MNKKSFVYTEIKKRILDGTLPPGCPINEVELARELNVSKTPVREALRELEKEGFVENIPGRGSTVSNISFNDIREIFEIREILECGAAKRAALLCNKEDVKAKRRQLEAFKPDQAEETTLSWGPEEDIHLYIIGVLNNKRLTEAYLRILDHIVRIRNQFGKRFTHHRREEILTEHLNILDALIEGNPEKAERAVQVHLRNAAAFLMGLILPRREQS
ncbi:GntR family transcriptional regulator [Thermodesulforhabdus norvegica]|uniref:DNA-binding transcriptional regulator, GntR family n=1 Tax=Thermodesulforhabdus norvegica TaxID=39841 RepID=A0A1I4VWR7_9BACT|nr:GntR family transcriptional regulator [Thermodesulforhabdus norvegica]SFN05683.1 DNA-binding transcriptional regulator, GntR family [Thermodesulforhabdus norvegica]